MQHLDEGLLQAWLDGPRSGLSPSRRADIERHLSGCEECTRRLEGLDQESGRVTKLLSESETVGEPIPEFEAVVARAGRHGATVRRRRLWTPVAWAASVVVAIGVGWIANESRRGGDEGRAAEDRLEVDGSVGESRLAQGRSASDSTSPGGAETEPASDSAPISLAAAEASPPPDASAPARQEVAAAPPSEHLLVEAERRVPADPAPLTVQGTITSESGQPLRHVQVYVEGTRFGALTARDGTYRIPLPGLPRDSAETPLTLRAELIGYQGASRVLPVPGGNSVSADFSLTSTAVQLEELVVTGTPVAAERRAVANAVELIVPLEVASGLAWRLASRSAAEADAGFSVLSVPGLPVVSIEVATSEGERLVRVVQELEGGGELVLVEGRSGVSFDEPGPDAGLAHAITRRDDLMVAATAPLPVEKLEALLDRLR